MLRLIGSLFMLIGTCGYGLCLCREMRRRLDCLREMRRMYELLFSQVGYCMADVPEACRMASEYLSSPYSELLQEIEQEAGKNTGKALPQIWKELSEQYAERLPLKQKDKILLVDFARGLGYADQALQKSAIERQLLRLGQVIQEIEMHMAEREKMMLSVSVMGGLLLVIVLL